MSWTTKHYHFIGIGGIGMGAIAALLLDKGCKVSGSDMRSNQITESLIAKGATIYVGHSVDHLRGDPCVVYSSAIKRDNPELSEARERELEVRRRADLLAELMKDYIGITVAGAHGKTTTTSMLSSVLTSANFNPTTAVGGILKDRDTNAYLGTSDYFLAEVDESDGSFLHFLPNYSIITNMDNEHLDFYENFNAIIRAYRDFIKRTDPEGLLIVCSEDKNLMQLVVDSPAPVKTYGFSKEDYVRATNIEFEAEYSEFDCFIQGKVKGRIRLAVPGMHNVANALAAICLADHLEVSFEAIAKGLKEFQGVQRRFEVLGEYQGVRVIDDYAHHPTEIAHTLQTANLIKNNRLVTIFQPHRYSRFEALWQEFKDALEEARYLIVTDVYAASEQEREGVSAAQFVEELKVVREENVIYIPKEQLIDYLKDYVESGDTILSLGAGDLRGIMQKFLEAEKETIGISS